MDVGSAPDAPTLDQDPQRHGQHTDLPRPGDDQTSEETSADNFATSAENEDTESLETNKSRDTESEVPVTRESETEEKQAKYVSSQASNGQEIDNDSHQESFKENIPPKNSQRCTEKKDTGASSDEDDENEDGDDEEVEEEDEEEEVTVTWIEPGTTKDDRSVWVGWAGSGVLAKMEDDLLGRIFKKCGHVMEATVVKDVYTGASRRFVPVC